MSELVPSYANGWKTYNTEHTGRLTIPQTVTYNDVEYSVTSIGNNAFSGCNGFSGSLTIGNSVMSIGSSAFYNCHGFTGSLTIPNSVVSIGDGAFDNCGGLSKLTVLATTPPTLGSDNFSYTKAIYVPQGTRASYIATNSWKHFANNRIFIEIGEEVLTINVATAGTLWDELDAAGKHPSTVGRLKLSGTLGDDDWDLIKNNMTVLYDLDLSKITNTTIPNKAFEDSKITNFKFPQGLTSIGSSAFSGSNICGALELPSSITSIGSSAFSGCSGFTGSLTIPDGVTSIKYGTFSDCSGFTGSLTIPNSVVSIGEYAFNDCNGFTDSLTISEGVTSIGSYTFAGCSGLTGSLTIPDGVTSIRKLAFYGCRGFTGTVKLPDGLTSIEGSILGGCSHISHVIIPDKVRISPSAFSGCTAIDTLTCLAVNPMALSENFATIDPATCILQVPIGARKNYARAAVWGNFLNIQEIEVGAPSKLVKLRISEGGTVSYAGELVANNSTLSIEQDSTLALSIAPQAGYAVESITLGSTDITSSYQDGTLSVAISQEAELSISFEEVSYEVSYYVEGSAARQIMVANYNDDIAYRIVAEAGYTIESVTVNGSEVSLSAEGLLELNNIQEDKIVLVKTQEDKTTELRSTEASSLTAWVAMEILFVELSPEMKQIRVVDAAGRIIYSKPTNGYEILQVPLSQVGAYIVQVQMQDGSVQTAKVLNR